MKEKNYKEKNCSTDALNAHAVGDSKYLTVYGKCNIKNKGENVSLKKDINDGDTRESEKEICDVEKQESKRDISCKGTRDSDSDGTMNCDEKEPERQTKKP